MTSSYLSWLESDTAHLSAVVYDVNIISLKLTYCDVQSNTLENKDFYTKSYVDVEYNLRYAIAYKHMAWYREKYFSLLVTSPFNPSQYTRAH